MSSKVVRSVFKAHLMLKRMYAMEWCRQWSDVKEQHWECLLDCIQEMHMKPSDSKHEILGDRKVGLVAMKLCIKLCCWLTFVKHNWELLDILYLISAQLMQVSFYRMFWARRYITSSTALLCCQSVWSCEFQERAEHHEVVFSIFSRLHSIWKDFAVSQMSKRWVTSRGWSSVSTMMRMLCGLHKLVKQPMQDQGKVPWAIQVS